MSGTQLWLSEPIPNDDIAVTGLELATLWLRVLHPNHCTIIAYLVLNVPGITQVSPEHMNNV